MRIAMESEHGDTMAQQRGGAPHGLLQVQAYQIAMPRNVTTEQDLMRALQDGPQMGSSKIDQDIRKLEK